MHTICTMTIIMCMKSCTLFLHPPLTEMLTFKESNNSTETIIRVNICRIVTGLSIVQCSMFLNSYSFTHLESETRENSYLEVPPSAAIFETNMFSSSPEDLNYMFYVLTLVLALVPILNTTAKKEQKKNIFGHFKIQPFLSLLSNDQGFQRWITGSFCCK